ncbi:MAG: NusG domain II-containing protein [Clostridia bacterium]|nr:NusG domain II-containing protein [Clostridia bacterium]
MKNKPLKKADIFIVLGVAALALLFIFLRGSKSERRIAVITVDSAVTDRIDLDEVKEKITIMPDTDPQVVIAAENGVIYFESSGCRDKICVKSGRLSKAGDIAVCLPAKTVVSITGSGPDAVTY